MLNTQEIPVTPQPNIAVENAVTVTTIENTIWTKFIPKVNRVFMVLSLLFVFGLDLLILILSSSFNFSSFDLFPFWIKMLKMLGIFILFYFFENRIFSKRFADSKSALDPWICFAVVIRNIVIFLNFIPFIQLLGMLISMHAGIPYLIAYTILIALRYKNAKT